MRSSLLSCALALASGAPSSTGIVASTTVPLLGLWELRGLLAPTNSTPFNATSLGTWVEVTSPNATTVSIVMPFFYRAFDRSQSANGTEVLVPAGVQPSFVARFAPRALGIYSYVQRFSASPPPPWLIPVSGTFECVTEGAIEGDGYAHVDKRHSQYFTLDDERAMWLVGENMAWAGVWPYSHGSSRYSNGTGETYAFDRWLPKLASAGGNFIRLWLGPSLVRQPTFEGELGTMLGLSLHGSNDGTAIFGSYNLQSAWRIDYIVELARQLGVKIALVIDAQQSFCDGGESNAGWCFWGDSVYNVANGGPLSDPSQYFSHALCMRELRQRWSYIVSRWGYSTSIFSWELANEQDDWPAWKSSSAVVMSEQAAIAAWLPTIDVNKHMVDNSFGGTRVQRGFEDLPAVAFTSVHSYDDADVAALVWRTVTPRVALLGKPSFVEECGASWRGPLEHELDPTGIGMHTGAWASLVGMSSGSAMQWWWNEVDTLATYDRLTGAATLSRALSTQLLQFNFSIWPHSSTADLEGGAGWTVGRDAEGDVALALFYVYGANFTWAQQHAGAPLVAQTAVTITLYGLPLAHGVMPHAVCYNTSTGTALEAPARCGASLEPTSGDVVISFPPFVMDAAAVVSFVA